MDHTQEPAGAPGAVPARRERRAGQRVPRSRRARLAGVLIVVGLLAAGCGGGAAASSGGSSAASSTTTTTTAPASATSAKTKSLPDCGSLRDPLDPTDSAPPSGSPAIC